MPVFLLSLPRAGSTLVQRVLTGHPEIASAPEPWILLPQIYAMRVRGTRAEYVHGSAARAIREFAERLPGGEACYWEEVRAFATRLYDRASEGRGRYFLDKTPRYHLILEDLFRLFPDAKFVFLWRNPLAIVASIIETWGGGRWKVHRWRVDLYDGISNLLDGYRANAGRVCAVRYEDLVDDAAAWQPVFDHLEVPFSASLLSDFASVRLEGRMGDPRGTRRYDSLSTEPLDKWKATLASPLRKHWSRRYLRWIGEERLAAMGYRLEDLLRDLDAIPSRPRHLVSDVSWRIAGRVTVSGKRAVARVF